MNCRKCGNPIMPGSNTCTACGAPYISNDFSNTSPGVSSMPGQPMEQPQFSQPPMPGQSMGQSQFSQPPMPGQSMGQPQFSQPPMPGQPMGQSQFSQPPMPGQPMGQAQFSQPSMPGQPMGQPQFSQPPMPGQPMEQPQFSQPSMPGQPMGQPQFSQPPMPVQPTGQPLVTSNSVGTNVPQYPATPVDSGKTKNMSKIIVMVVLIVIVILGLGAIVIFSGALNKEDTPKNENKTEQVTKEEPKDTPQDLSKLVTIKEQTKTSNGGIFITLKNDSDKVVNTTITITFYDENGSNIGTTSDFVTTAPKNDGYIHIDKYYVIENAARYEVSMVHLDYSSMQEIINIDESQLIKNDTGDELTVQYTNTRSETISRVGFMLLCYSNDTLVNVKQVGVADINSGGLASQKFSLKKIRKENPFDRYVVITTATIDVKND